MFACTIAVLLDVPSVAACSSVACSSMGCPSALTINIVPNTSQELKIGTYEVDLVFDGTPKTFKCYSEPDVGPGCTDGDAVYDPDFKATQWPIGTAGVGPTRITIESRAVVKLVQLTVSRDGTILVVKTLKPNYPPVHETECGPTCTSTTELVAVE